ncbi:uncharacterized protein LOC131299521 [Rhododendron vialii]|uniref:uncharacterized protein LOC131299521 n=1 Tax=Rhododendron vialii TaxID=182163 RepID=UPI00265E2604|nr:uncharacterized protein LOC131299521 [Rhododendron vialii]
MPSISAENPSLTNTLRMSGAMFVFEVHHGLLCECANKKGVQKIATYINSKLPDCDLDGGLRELKTNKVWDMFAIHNDRETIFIYEENVELNVVDDVVNLDSDIEKSDGNESESGADPTSPRGSIGSSDLEFFGDGDELYDLRDKIRTKQVRETFIGGSEPFSFNMGSGSGEGPSNLLPPDIQEVEDDDLNTPMNSDEQGKVEFPEFFEDRDMERPDLVVSQAEEEVGLKLVVSQAEEEVGLELVLSQTEEEVEAKAK